MIEMCCETLVTRFELIKHQNSMDESLAKAIATVIWAAPRLQTDVSEMEKISKCLTTKYGRKFSDSCRENRLNIVCCRLMDKLGVQAPSKALVEKYLIGE